MMVKRLLQLLFTWWNGNTVGTKFYTFLYGVKVGEDYFGNFYYESKDKKNRWCIFSNQSDASKVSPEWNSWLRFITDIIPKSFDTRYKWQKTFRGNATGLNNAYRPNIIGTHSSMEESEKYKSDYKAWKPE